VVTLPAIPTFVLDHVQQKLQIKYQKEKRKYLIVYPVVQKLYFLEENTVINVIQ
jgi:hypothetical protein